MFLCICCVSFFPPVHPLSDALVVFYFQFLTLVCEIWLRVNFRRVSIVRNAYMFIWSERGQRKPVVSILPVTSQILRYLIRFDCSREFGVMDVAIVWEWLAEEEHGTSGCRKSEEETCRMSGRAIESAKPKDDVDIMYVSVCVYSSRE